jgi:hypothetical protein
MAGKPFSIQAPESIAKEYGGNKQRIAQAVQSGLIDPTAAVLAGMFIDRMRSAQIQEQAPTQTVAQQVMAPPAPPAAPTMGAPAAPPMGAPAAPPGMAMGGYAGGGLDALDVPEFMFDEPTNGGFDDGYAGGGMVAFQVGGDVREERKRQLRAKMRVAPTTAEYNELRAQLESMEKRGPTRAELEARDSERDAFRPATTIATRPHPGVPQARYTGEAPEPLFTLPQRDAFTPTTISSTRPHPGLPQASYVDGGPSVDREALLALSVPPARPTLPPARYVDGGPSVDREALLALSVPPARPTLSPARGGVPPGGLAAITPTSPTAPVAPTPEAKAMTPEEYMEMYKRMSGGDAAQPYRERQMKMLEETLSPEAGAKSKEEAKWMALTQLGASLAASKSPYFLQAVGEATQAALPGLAASKKERKIEINQALQAAAANEGLTRQEQRDYAKAGLDLFSQSEERRLKIQELLDNKEYRQAALEFQKYEANLQHLDRMAGVRAQLAVGMRPTDTQFLADFQKRDPEGFEKFMAVRYGSTAEAGIPGFPQVGGSGQRPIGNAGNRPTLSSFAE